MRIHDWRLGERKIEIRLQGGLAAFSVTVIPAKAGIHSGILVARAVQVPDSRLRGNDVVAGFGNRHSRIGNQSAIGNRKSAIR